MKRKNANATGFIIIIALLGVITYLVTRPREVVRVPVQVPMRVHQCVRESQSADDSRNLETHL